MVVNVASLGKGSDMSSAKTSTDQRDKPAARAASQQKPKKPSHADMLAEYRALSAKVDRGLDELEARAKRLLTDP